MSSNGPKVLLIDIETAPIIADVWGLWENNVSLNQIIKDWHVLSWSAKWLDSDKIMYMDQRNEKNIENDKEILKGIWKLLDEADIVIGHNSKQFDVKKLNSRFIIHGMQPPSSFKQIDTLSIAKKYFNFTSNKLEYLTKKLCKKYKKLSHKQFPGHELWTECLKNNKKAWKEMEKYNKYDVLALEELYHILKAWDTSINFNLYSNDTEHVCKCGSHSLQRYGFAYTSVGRYQRYKCKQCGAESRDSKNLFSLEKRRTLKRSTTR